MYKKFLITIILAIFCVAIFVTACARQKISTAQPSSVPVKSNDEITQPETVNMPAPSAEPTPKPVSKDSAQKLAKLISAFDATAYLPAVSPYIPMDGYDNASAAIVMNKGALNNIINAYDQWLFFALENMKQIAIEEYGDVRFNTEITLPSWQMMGAVAILYEGQPALFAQAFPMLINADITLKSINGYIMMNVSIKPVEDPVLFYSLPQMENGNMGGLFTYTYLKTMYDKNVVPYNEQTMPDPKIYHQITFPFEDTRYFDNTWHNSRDGGTRLHTGTDINAPEGTPLLACVDGRILDAGTNEGAGNYVVLLSKHGYQYHYYHMVEPTADVAIGDYVAAGDIVGRTGNTGNSTANHLHLSIINKEGYYINPYPYLIEAMEHME